MLALFALPTITKFSSDGSIPSTITANPQQKTPAMGAQLKAHNLEAMSAVKR
jgi:hypothetical protein